jgi:hypothetical protein
MARRSRDVSAEAFLDATLQCFERAVSRTGLRQLDGVVAGAHIRFQVAGDALADALLDGLYPWPPPPDGSGDPDAVLCAFDSERGGEVPPPPPWSSEDYRPRDEVRGFTAGRWRASYALTRSSLWFHDTERNLGVGWMRELPAPDSRERAVPWWVALHWALSARGRHLIHAACAGGVLLVGPGGSGKSTTTYTAAAAGLPCAGDDYVVLVDDRGEWSAHAVYRWARLDDASLDRFPRVRRVYRDDEKTGIELPGAVDSLPVRAIVVPRVAERTGSPRPLSQADALRALAPSTLLQAPGSDPELAGELGRLVRSVPTLSLEVGPDLEAIPAAIEEAASAVARA